MTLAKCPASPGDPEVLWRRYGDIVRSCCARHRVHVDLVRGYERDPRVVACRRDAYSCLWGSGLSYSDIGRMFGRDHTTIISGVRRELAA